MKKRLSSLGRIVGRLLIFLFVFLIGLTGYSMIWEQQQIEKLAKGSVVVETDLGVIEYAEIGNGPAILAIHGSPGGYAIGQDGAFWAQAGFRYLSLSRPGYLRTPVSVGKTMEEQADAMAALLDALAIEKVTIIASSGGGPSGLQFALRHPERCSSLVLISAVVQQLENNDSGRRAIAIESTSLVSWIFTTIITEKPEWVFPSLDPLLAPNGDPRQYDEYIAISLEALPFGPRRDGWLNDFEQMWQLPDYPLAEITCPTLIVHGLEDTQAPFRAAEHAAETIPNAEILKLEGGHLAPIMQRETVMPKIADFLKLHNP